MSVSLIAFEKTVNPASVAWDAIQILVKTNVSMNICRNMLKYVHAVHVACMWTQ